MARKTIYDIACRLCEARSFGERAACEAWFGEHFEAEHPFGEHFEAEHPAELAAFRQNSLLVARWIDFSPR